VKGKVWVASLSEHFLSVAAAKQTQSASREGEERDKQRPMAYARTPESLLADQTPIRAELQEIPRDEVLGRRMDWASLHGATMLQDREYALITEYDKKPIEVKIQKIQTVCPSSFPLLCCCFFTVVATFFFFCVVLLTGRSQYPREYADTFLSILSQVNSNGPLQYTLALIDEIFGCESFPFFLFFLLFL